MLDGTGSELEKGSFVLDLTRLGSRTTSVTEGTQ